MLVSETGQKQHLRSEALELLTESAQRGHCWDNSDETR